MAICWVVFIVMLVAVVGVYLVLDNYELIKGIILKFIPGLSNLLELWRI